MESSALPDGRAEKDRDRPLLDALTKAVFGHVKHTSTPTRRDAGIAADAVIELANLIRRPDEPT